MQGTRLRKINGKLKSLLFWRVEGKGIAVYWDSEYTKKQTTYLMGEGSSSYRNETGAFCHHSDPTAWKQSEFIVGLTFDLALIGLNETTLNAAGFATAVPIS